MKKQFAKFRGNRYEESTKLAFGVEPSKYHYRLRLARYIGVAQAIAKYVQEREASSQCRLDLLDIGVGLGRTLAYAEKEGVADLINFTGVDVSKRRLSNIYEPEKWNLVMANLEKGLPFGSNTFHICICEQVLEHLDNPDTVLSEIDRVLCPGGLFILGVPIRPLGLVQLRRFFIFARKRIFRGCHSHKQAFDTRLLKTLVARHENFIIKEVQGFRILSGGLLAFMENFHWWYRINQFLGRRFPGLCIEVQLIIRKRGRSLPLA